MSVRLAERSRIVLLAGKGMTNEEIGKELGMTRQKAGISRSSVGRIWQSHGLKPHRISTFKVSNDKEFAEKLEAIVGLYLSPPENAIVFRCDEKSQIQALDRTQPGLPMKKGRAATMTINVMAPRPCLLH